jgi:hypothetical protein
METYEIQPFETEVKRMGHLVQKLRESRKVTIFDGSTKTFYRFRLDRTEKRVYWIKEASLDQRNWIKQIYYLSLKGVMKEIYRNKVRNNIDD